MSGNNAKPSTDVVIHARLSYAFGLFVPKANKSNVMAYNVTLVLPAGPQQEGELTKLKAAMKQAMENKWGLHAEGKWPRNGSYRAVPQIIRPVEEVDGLADFHGLDGTASGAMFVRAAAYKVAPEVVQPDGKTRAQESDAYSGRWANVALQPYWFQNPENKGIALGLNAVQLMEHAEQIGGGRKQASAYFQPAAIPGSAAGGGAAGGNDPFGIGGGAGSLDDDIPF